MKQFAQCKVIRIPESKFHLQGIQGNALPTIRKSTTWNPESTGTFHLSELAGRTSGPDHCPTSQFENEMGFFQEFLLKNHLPRAYYLGFDWSGLRVLIKREIIICDGNGLAGPVLTKRKAPQDWLGWPYMERPNERWGNWDYTMNFVISTGKKRCIGKLKL